MSTNLRVEVPPETITTAPLRLGPLGLAAVLILFGISGVFRLLWLDRIPGLNGDEGWYGSQITRALNGRPWSAITPCGLPINPELFGTEAILLLLTKPTVLVLRFPAVMWGMVGVVLTYFLHRWVYRDRAEAVLTALLAACLPAQIVYARILWDASFSCVSLPLVLYSTLRITERDRATGTWACFVLGAILTIWTHATHALFVAACLVVIAWGWIGPWCAWSVATSPRRRATVVVGLSTLLVCLVWRWDFFIRFVSFGDSWLVERCEIGWLAITSVIDLVTGLRAYEYFVGLPRPSWTGELYAASLLAGGTALVSLVRSERKADRVLAVLVPLIFLMLLAPFVSRLLRYGELSYERYVFYFVPLTIAAFIRTTRRCVLLGRPWSHAVPAALSVACSGLLLAQFWQYYLDASQKDAFWERLDATTQNTYRTGPIEPKAAAVDAILNAVGSARARVYGEDWSMWGPIEYLTGGRFDVTSGPIEFESGVPLFVVGYSGSRYIATVQAESRRRQWRMTEQLFRDAHGRAVVSLLVLEDSSEGLVVE